MRKVTTLLFVVAFFLTLSSTISSISYATGAVSTSASSPTLVASVSTGAHSRPTGVVVDSKDHKVFVADVGGPSAPFTNITVINTETNKIIDVIHLNVIAGLGSAVVYDPANDGVYFAGSSVYVVNGSDDKVVANISLPAWSDVCSLCGMAVDSARNEIFIMNLYQNVTVINVKTDRVVGEISVPQQHKADELLWIAFDPNNGKLYVSDYSDEVVFVLNPITMKTVSTIDIPCSNDGNLVHDSENNEIYVACETSSAVVVIGGSSNKVVATVQNASYASLIVADPKNGNIYAVSLSLYVINGNTNALTGTFNFGLINPRSMAVFPAIDRLYISDFDLNKVLVISTS